MQEEWFHKLASYGVSDAFVDKDQIYSYFDLVDTTVKYSSWLKGQGVKLGDAVILNDDFSFSSICMLLALANNKNIVIPITNITEKSMLSIEEYCNPKYRLSTNKKLLINKIEVNKNNVEQPSNSYLNELKKSKESGLVLLSSGSTGKPKAILHSLDKLLASKVIDRKARKLKTILFLLFDHIGGLNTVFNVLFSGGIAVNPKERTPLGVSEAIDKYKANILPTSPTFLNLLMMSRSQEKYDFSSIRLITYGTESMPESLLLRARKVFPKARLLQTFGTSETGIAKTTSKSSNSTEFKFNDPNMKYKIVEGELYLKSNTQFLDYLNGEGTDNITSNGWFKTGDMVEEFEGGYLKIVGRKSEVINVGGEKVLPLELESILLESPMISDCMVYGRNNVITGQSVNIDVKAAQTDISRSEIRQHILEFLKGKVDRFKLPTKINLVEDIGITERFKKLRRKAV